MHMQQPCVTGARAIGGTSPPFRQVSSTHPIAALNLGTPERRKASLCRQMALLLQSVSASEASDRAVMQGKLVFHHTGLQCSQVACERHNEEETVSGPTSILSHPGEHNSQHTKDGATIFRQLEPINTECNIKEPSECTEETIPR
ncbi:unnamed protein product [Gadus morhua 'NCC']